MPEFNYLSQLTSWLPFRSSRRRCIGPTTARELPRLEELGDRTLLSGFTYTVAIVPPIAPIAPRELPFLPATPFVDLIGLADRRWDRDAATSARMGESRLTSTPLAGTDPVTINPDNPGAQTHPFRVERIEHALLTTGQPIELVRLVEQATDNPDELPRLADIGERALADQGIIAYFLRDDDEHGDRHFSSESSGHANDDGDESDDRPDMAGTEVIVTERNDNALFNRPLANIFRDQQADQQCEEEIPADRVPDLLVAYDPDLSTPRAELLPLEDGNRVLVATLVSSVSGSDSDAPLSAAPASEAVPLGAPVGLDSGPPLAYGSVIANELVGTPSAKQHVNLGLDNSDDVDGGSELLVDQTIETQAQEIGRGDRISPKPASGVIGVLVAAGLVIVKSPPIARLNERRRNQFRSNGQGRLGDIPGQLTDIPAI
jgi:hypothetical protein